MSVRALWVAVGIFVLAVGCNRGPSRIAAPSWDPELLADAVLAKCDKNTDGSIDKKELAAAPGLAWGSKAIDTDKNGSLSRDELVARFAIYKKMKIAITSTQAQVFYKGRALNGARVTLTPESFLEGIVEPAVGEVADGYVMPLVEGLDPPGLRPGYYRVVVESSQAKLPAKYAKAETTSIGVEVSPISDPTAPASIQFVLND